MDLLIVEFIFQTVQVIIVTICNQLAKILASVFPVLSDTLMDGVSGSTTIITAKQCMQNHKLLSLNAVKELVLYYINYIAKPMCGLKFIIIETAIN